MVVVEILGVVKLFEPLLNAEPPVAAPYQSTVDPDAGVAEIATTPVPQRELDPAVGADGADN